MASFHFLMRGAVRKNKTGSVVRERKGQRRERERERERATKESQSCKVQSGEKGKIENLVMSQKADKILK